MQFLTRLKAAVVHLAITALVAGVVAGVIFGIWFPGGFSDMVGGKKLFTLVLACDLVLGPLISLVIYDLRKPRAELVRDYIIVGVLQLAALCYGVLVVAESRPAYIVFAIDRLEVVTALELEDADLALATSDDYRTRGWGGPRLVSVRLPEDANERMAILRSALAGKDIQLMPRYYRPYAAETKEILERSLPVSELNDIKPEYRETIEAEVQKSGRKEEQLRWLPVRHRFGFWVAFIDGNSGQPLSYLPIDAYSG